MGRKLAFFLFLTIVLILSGCNSKENENTENKDTIKVYTTVYPLKDFTEKIGGKYVETGTVYPPGTDEHSFEPTQKDIIKMADSDLFFYIGHNLEGFVTKAKPILEQEGVKMTAIGEKVHLEEENGTSEGDASEHNDEHSDEHANGHGDTHEDSHEGEGDHHQHGGVDPHIWLDPVYSQEMAELIKDALVTEMPQQKAYFEDNYNKVEKQLQELDETFKTATANSKTNKIIVSHGAYGYWEDRYGIKQISVTGLSASSDPSQKQLQEIIKTAKQQGIHSVIFEQNTSSKLTEIIRKEIGAKSLTLHNLSVLTDKDLKDGEDYFSLMNKNAETLKTALH
ncbi:metal ABC transporter solute-binding protein, Zn/Mn family [Bacillus sp. V5-8f]|uniref:metal ABC transporter solute-binding protein, Zn/Mn family n=1 Tax=Bacillus sp. V5-8f TaxID=2053044 RepID=UPI000C785D02|nr:zinc ABC transporter substrate-binding protein [Bacillus sp. V5-8f]PLT32199.1 adhesin [Bacillus sp. V5-8f]